MYKAPPGFLAGKRRRALWLRYLFCSILGAGVAVNFYYGIIYGIVSLILVLIIQRASLQFFPTHNSHDSRKIYLYIWIYSFGLGTMALLFSNLYLISGNIAVYLLIMFTLSGLMGLIYASLLDPYVRRTGLWMIWNISATWCALLLGFSLNQTNIDILMVLIGNISVGMVYGA